MKRRYLRCSYITYKALKITVIIFHILVMRIQKIFESFSKVFEAMTTHKIFIYHSLQKVVRKADLSFSNVLFLTTTPDMNRKPRICTGGYHHSNHSYFCIRLSLVTSCEVRWCHQVVVRLSPSTCGSGQTPAEIMVTCPLTTVLTLRTDGI